MKKRLLALVMVLVLSLSMASALAEEQFVSTYGPIADGDVTLTIWLPMDDQAASYIDTVDGNVAWAEVEKRLGINLEFIQPPASNRAEMFQLMVASGNLPDIIQYQNEYVGGGEKAVADGVFLPINDYLEEYCPDYLIRMNEDPSRPRDCMEDSGLMYWFKNIMNRRQQSYNGLLIRGDWLEKLNLEMPTTYDEMHDVLVAFKENFTGGEAPMEIYQDGFGYGQAWCGGFNIEVETPTNDWFFYDEDAGEVVCSAFQDGFKEYIEMMAQWYAEGLIDPNYTTNIAPWGNPERIGSNKTGVYTGMFTQAGNYYQNSGIVEEGGYFDLVPPLNKNESDEHRFGQYRPSSVNTNGFVITSACKNVEAALRLINYFYTEEGSLLANYGLEGVTFEYGEDGKPYVNDLIKKNPNMNLSGARFANLIRNVGMYTYRDVEDDSVDEFQRKYMTVWDNKNYSNMIVQQYLSYTADESKEFASIMSDANTYILEWSNKFISGVTPLDQWDTFMSGLEALNIDRATELCEATYDRYMARSL